MPGQSRPNSSLSTSLDSFLNPFPKHVASHSSNDLRSHTTESSVNNIGLLPGSMPSPFWAQKDSGFRAAILACKHPQIDALETQFTQECGLNINFTVPTIIDPVRHPCFELSLRYRVKLPPFWVRRILGFQVFDYPPNFPISIVSRRQEKFLHCTQSQPAVTVQVHFIQTEQISTSNPILGRIGEHKVVDALPNTLGKSQQVGSQCVGLRH